MVLSDFADVSAWRIARNIAGEGACAIAAGPEARVGNDAMLVTDRTSADHAQWLELRCPDGVWDISSWGGTSLDVRGDGSGKTVYFKVVDEAGRMMCWEMGRLREKGWQQLAADLACGDSLHRHENPNLARIAMVGVRLDPHSGYEIVLDDLRLTDPIPPPRAIEPVATGPRLGCLAPRHVNDIEDSIVGVNLHPGVGELTETDIDRLAAAGVKWAARLPLDLDAHYDATLRRALLKHRFHLHGIFGVQKLLEGDDLALRLREVRRTVAGLRDIVRHWEIGNEPNIDKFWSGKPDATEFGRMICAFAEAIRAEQPDAVILSGGLVGYPLDFAREMMETGMGRWVDYVGIHTPRTRPEDGGRGLDHAAALTQLRALIREYNPRLDVWQSEVQATPNVTFAEVRGGITDFQQARHVARRFFIEQWLDYPASFWQLFKAGPALDHPGALIRVDGTPTMKFFAIQNVAAILDSRLERCDVSAPRIEPPPSPARLSGSTARIEVQSGGACVVDAFEAPFDANLDLRLEVSSGASALDARLVWLDARGRVMGSASHAEPVRAVKGTFSVCRRYPHAFRPSGATRARVEIRATPDAPVRIHNWQVIAHARAGEARAYAFRRRDDGALFVPYSLVPRPPVEAVRSEGVLRLTAAAAAFEKPVLVDMIGGSVTPVRPPRMEGGDLVFDRVPVTDYTIVLTDARWVVVRPESCLLDFFEGRADFLRQFIGDRFGRGRPEFWRLVEKELDSAAGDLADVFQFARTSFVGERTPAEGAAVVEGIPWSERELRRPSWRPSIVNSETRRADRVFAQVTCHDPGEADVRVLIDGKPMPKRTWSDAVESIGTWSMTIHEGALRVFVGIPDGGVMPDGVSVVYRSPSVLPRLFHFRERGDGRPCAVFWCDRAKDVHNGDDAGTPTLPSGAVRIVGPAADLPADAVLVNLATGERIRSVTAAACGDKVELRDIPMLRDPLLIAPAGR